MWLILAYNFSVTCCSPSKRRASPTSLVRLWHYHGKVITVHGDYPCCWRKCIKIKLTRIQGRVLLSVGPCPLIPPTGEKKWSQQRWLTPETYSESQQSVLVWANKRSPNFSEFLQLKLNAMRYDGQRGFPGGASDKEPVYQCRRYKICRFDPWVRKIPWRRAQQHTPVFLSGESHGQRSLAGYSPWCRKESDMTECTCVLTCV